MRWICQFRLRFPRRQLSRELLARVEAKATRESPGAAQAGAHAGNQGDRQHRGAREATAGALAIRSRGHKCRIRWVELRFAGTPPYESFNARAGRPRSPVAGGDLRVGPQSARPVDSLQDHWARIRGAAAGASRARCWTAIRPPASTSDWRGVSRSDRWPAIRGRPAPPRRTPPRAVFGDADLQPLPGGR